MSDLDFRFEQELLDRWIELRRINGKGLPLIIGEECYEHFGQRCQIVEANVYDTVENAEVVIEAGFGERTEVEFSRLSWDFGCRHNDSLSKMSLMDLIRNGSEAAND